MQGSGGLAEVRNQSQLVNFTFQTLPASFPTPRSKAVFIQGLKLNSTWGQAKVIFGVFRTGKSIIFFSEPFDLVIYSYFLVSSDSCKRVLCLQIPAQ